MLFARRAICPPMFPGIYHNRLQLRDNMPGVKTVRFSLPAAVFRQIDAQYLPAHRTDDPGKVLRFLLAAASSVDKQENRVCSLPIEYGRNLCNFL